MAQSKRLVGREGRAFVVGAVALCSACAAPAPKYAYEGEVDPRKAEYVIGPSDQLRINVWQNPDLSTVALVRPDGTITMPLVGDLGVSGRTPSSVRDEIVGRIAQFVRAEAAIVTVAVTEVNSYRFTVVGAVESPGAFDASHYVTVADAIAMAGGPTRFADTDGIELVRRGPSGDVRRIPIRYEDIRTSVRPEANLVLLAGDTVFVP
jgi:polysaccharide export outer membrane protein